jgi:hypothetical protein
LAVRVRVRFVYRADTGEVEEFRVDDVADGPRAADHDARHDAATLDVAEVVDPHPHIVEESGVQPGAARQAERQPDPALPVDRRLHD